MVEEREGRNQDLEKMEGGWKGDEMLELSMSVLADS